MLYPLYTSYIFRPLILNQCTDVQYYILKIILGLKYVSKIQIQIKITIFLFHCVCDVTADGIL